MRQSFAVLVAIAAIRCGEAPNMNEDTTTQTDYEAWRDGLPRTDDGRYLVEGDLPFRDDAGLRWYHAELTGAESTTPAALTSVYVPGAFWSEDQKRNLSYCVSDAIGDNKAKAVEAMRVATRTWESVADVRFVYKPEQDANCNNTNNAVVFNVRNGCVFNEGKPVFSARAFMPWFARPDRELIVCQFPPAASPETLEGRVLHELGHALGFIHEHERPECQNNQNLPQNPLTTYDPLSVMHYPEFCNGPPAYDFFLTARDIAGVQEVYGAMQTRRVAFRTYAGCYLSAEGGGGGALSATGKHLGPWETFELVQVSGDQYGIRAWGGDRRYLRALNEWLYVDQWQRGGNELFRLLNQGSDVFAIQAPTGKYLDAKDGGCSGVKASASGATQSDHFRMVRLDDDSFALESVLLDGKYVRFHKNRTVTMKTTRVDRYSQFNVVELGADQVALRTSDGLYLSALNGGNDFVIADRDIVQEWETFTRTANADGTVTFKTVNNNYLLAWGESFSSKAFSTQGDGTRFRLRNTRGTKSVALQAWNGKYVAAQEGGGGALVADAAVAGVWETYGLVDLGDSRVALRAHNGNYVTALQGGGGVVVADRDWIDAWETFKLVSLPDGKVALKTANGKFLRAPLPNGTLKTR